MDEIVENHIANRSFPECSFAITFDDGFENNYSIAAPILSDLNLPAMFYVSTEMIENNSMSWIDRIEYCLERKHGGALRFDWSDEALSFDGKLSKIKLLELLRKKVKTDSGIDLEEFVHNVFSQCGIEPINQSDDPLDKKMDWKQVCELNNDKLFTVGGHSHHHLNLAFLDADELEFEVGTSICFLKERAGIDPKHYSYPEGLKYCYSESVIEELKKNGVICSPTAIDGVNELKTDLFHLKRIMVD
jgi:peptidoglycan/xylan/chitin deacetylase (PgdA/CDA1 family)